VVIVDWSGPAQGPLYNVAQSNVQPTGAYVGEMHDYFGSLGHAVSNTHCIGLSLGAHVCGHSGKSSSGILQITKKIQSQRA
jgi:Lipase